MDGRWFQTAPPNSREDEDEHLQDPCYNQLQIESHLRYRTIATLMQNLDLRNHYTVRQQISGGTFSKVFLAQSTTSNQNFAIKTSIRRSKDDKIPRSILKEVLMLHDMDHENVIPFEECFSTTNEEGHTIFHLVFQLCSFDLNRLLHIANVHLTIGNQRTLTLSLLAGLKYIHLKNIVHRDLKPHNILISESGRLKIADFGTATYYVSETPQTLSPTVGTPGYIAPELLLGSENYGAEIDIWSAGIIAAEIILGNEIIPGGTTRSQLRSIGRMFGGQPISKWERWGQFPLLNEYSREVTYPETGSIQNKLDQLPGTEKVNGARLIKKMLKLCPRKRVTASRAQNDAWFLTTPPPAETIPEVVRAVMVGKLYGNPLDYTFFKAQRAVPRR